MKKTDMETQVAVIAVKVANIESKVMSIETKLEGKYVTKEEFDPIKKLVYGVVSLILTAVIVALVGLVIVRQP